MRMKKERKKGGREKKLMVRNRNWHGGGREDYVEAIFRLISFHLGVESEKSNMGNMG